jgi:hypothetical protein
MSATHNRRAALSLLATSSFAMLPALAVMQCSGRAEAAVGSSQAWQSALAAYRRARKLSDETPLGHPEEDARVTTYCEVQDVLFKTIAPDHAALITKIEMIAERFDGFCLDDEQYGWIIADVRSLAGRA